MKQTSIEWFAEKDTILTIQFLEGKLNQTQLALEKMQCFQQAKEMHKQEIIDAFGIGCHHESKRLVGYQDVAEQYYNETFKQNKQ